MNLVLLVSEFSICIPILLGILFFGQNQKFKPFIFYLLVLGITQLLMSITSIMGIRNLAILNTSLITSLLICNRFLLVTLDLRRYFKILIVITLFLITHLLISDISTFNRLLYLTHNISILILSLTLIYQSITKGSINFFQTSELWIGIGLVFYYTSSTFPFIALELSLFHEDTNLTKVYTHIQPIINIIANLMYAYAFVCQWKTNKTSLTSS